MFLDATMLPNAIASASASTDTAATTCIHTDNTVVTKLKCSAVNYKSHINENAKLK